MQALGVIPLYAQNSASYITQLTKKETAEIAIKSLIWDKEYPKRYPPEWICYHGISVITKNKPELVPEKDYIYARTMLTNNFLWKTAKIYYGRRGARNHVLIHYAPSGLSEYMFY